MRKLFKRFAAAASAVVIGGVSCVTTSFSVPVSAAGGFGWLEWAEFESLLQGVGFSSGGGGYKNVQEATLDWLNMTSDQFYKLTDPTDGGNAKPIWEQSWWGDMTDWLDHVFGGDDGYSKVADVGADVSGGGLPGLDWVLSSNGIALFDCRGKSSDPWFYPQKPGLGRRLYYDKSSNFAFAVCSCSDAYYMFKLNSSGTWVIDTYSPYSLSFSEYPDGSGSLSGGGYTFISESGYNRSAKNVKGFVDFYPTYQSVIDVMSSLGVEYGHFDSYSSALNWLNENFSTADWKSSAVSDDFIGPVYTYPAAQDLYKSTGTAAGIRLDVQTEDGVPDIQAALNGAGVDTVDDLVAGVAAGTVPMSKVFADAKVTPYVVADTSTGAVVTDLGVSATATGVKAVGLTQELAVPKDLTTAAAYTIKGKTWDPEMSKYKLPLFEYFPFCLPWDIYQVLAAFSADPVAPVFDVPVGKILSGVRSVDASKAASVSAKIDFGDDNWSKVFEIIRILECAGIIVGLCLVAVYLIHGGR